MAETEVCGVQQARVVAIAGLHHGEGVWRPMWHLAPARMAMGCCGDLCGMWQLPYWDMGCSVGVSYSDYTPDRGPVTAVLWQQAVGAFGGEEGGVAVRETKGLTLGGLGLNISLLCGGYGFLQLLPGGRESFSNRADTN